MKVWVRGCCGVSKNASGPFTDDLAGVHEDDLSATSRAIPSRG